MNTGVIIKNLYKIFSIIKELRKKRLNKDIKEWCSKIENILILILENLEKKDFLTSNETQKIIKKIIEIQKIGKEMPHLKRRVFLEKEKIDNLFLKLQEKLFFY
ncbi:MAG: hypothetical protein V1910_00100 [bacterium]